MLTTSLTSKLFNTTPKNIKVPARKSIQPKLPSINLNQYKEVAVNSQDLFFAAHRSKRPRQQKSTEWDSHPDKHGVMWRTDRHNNYWETTTEPTLSSAQIDSSSNPFASSSTTSAWPAQEQHQGAQGSFLENQMYDSRFSSDVPIETIERDQTSSSYPNYAALESEDSASQACSHDDKSSRKRNRDQSPEGQFAVPPPPSVDARPRKGDTPDDEKTISDWNYGDGVQWVWKKDYKSARLATPTSLPKSVGYKKGTKIPDAAKHKAVNAYLQQLEARQPVVKKQVKFWDEKSIFRHADLSSVIKWEGQEFGSMEYKYKDIPGTLFKVGPPRRHEKRALVYSKVDPNAKNPVYIRQNSFEVLLASLEKPPGKGITPMEVFKQPAKKVSGSQHESFHDLGSILTQLGFQEGVHFSIIKASPNRNTIKFIWLVDLKSEKDSSRYGAATSSTQDIQPFTQSTVYSSLAMMDSSLGMGGGENLTLDQFKQQALGSELHRLQQQPQGGFNDFQDQAYSSTSSYPGGIPDINSGYEGPFSRPDSPEVWGWKYFPDGTAKQKLPTGYGPATQVPE